MDNVGGAIVALLAIAGFVAYQIYKYKNYIKQRQIMIEKFPMYEINFMNKTIALGMQPEVITFILGKPQDSKEQVIKEKVKKSCFYGGRQTQRGNTKYSFRVDFENDIVIGWKEL